MADTFSERKVKQMNVVVVSEEITFDGATASWTVPNGMKVIHASAEIVSGTGDGSIRWSGSTVTLGSVVVFTNGDVIRLWATCYPGGVGATGSHFGLI